MKASATNPKVDAYFAKTHSWREEMEKLRSLLLGRGSLVEDFKWGKPCYTVNGKNVVLILAFKESCALLLCKGALLKDPEGILIAPSENTQSARQIRFTSVDEVRKLEKALKGYIDEAVKVEEAGLEVTFKTIDDYELPTELQVRLDSDATLEAAFKALTPGRQRFYILHISGAKQAKTRESRVEKCVPLILAGKGLND